MSKLLRVVATMNAALLIGILLIPAAPSTAYAAWFDCCKSSTAGQRFCCDNCCWLTHDCSVDSQCSFDDE